MPKCTIYHLSGRVLLYFVCAKLFNKKCCPAKNLLLESLTATFFSALNCNSLQCSKRGTPNACIFSSLTCIMQRAVFNFFSSLHCTRLHCGDICSNALHCNALHRTKPNFTMLKYTLLHSICALHYATFSALN